MHLIIDGFSGDAVALDNLESVVSFLLSMPPLLGMTMIDGPRALRYEPPKPVDAGITGGVYIAESHITVHTFPAVASAMIDVCSCKPFNTDVALRAATKAFGFGTVRHHVIRRMLLPSLADAIAGGER